MFAANKDRKVRKFAEGNIFPAYFGDIHIYLLKKLP